MQDKVPVHFVEVTYALLQMHSAGTVTTSDNRNVFSLFFLHVLSE